MYIIGSSISEDTKYLVQNNCYVKIDLWVK